MQKHQRLSFSFFYEPELFLLFYLVLHSVVFRLSPVGFKNTAAFAKIMVLIQIQFHNVHHFQVLILLALSKKASSCSKRPLNIGITEPIASIALGPHGAT